MPGHRLDARIRRALRRGLTVQVRRGFPRPTELARLASAVRRISPISGETIGVIFALTAGQLKLKARPPWCFQRKARPC